MSLLDFFRAKPAPAPQPITVAACRNECDITKTYIVATLLKVPRDQRNDQWYRDFYDNVATASFASASPQVLTGPDGFRYFILKTPEPDKTFESFCIKNMAEDFLLKQGWGVVFNPAEDKSADWVFTHGNIVNLHLNNQFVTPTNDEENENIEFTKNVGVIKKAEQVMIAQPSESYLPAATRQVLKQFLQMKGIKKPKLMLLTSGTEGRLIQKLALNIDPGNYPVAKLDYLMQQVGWFLPNNYILIPLEKKSSLAMGFNEM